MAVIAVQLVMGLGGMLLTALFTPSPRPVGLPPVEHQRALRHAGQVIPRVWGTMKIPATMIFARPLIETMHTHQASRRAAARACSAATPRKTTRSPIRSTRPGVCLGPVYRINRIWANQKLLYVDPQVQTTAQRDFDAAYQAEATRLIDEEGRDAGLRGGSALRVRVEQLLDGRGHAEFAERGGGLHHVASDRRHGWAHRSMLYPEPGQRDVIIGQLYSGLNNQNTYLSQINRFDLIEIYLGTDGQGPNGLLEGYLGQGNAPAFRNCAYFVITNLQLMDFGNAVPTMTAEVQRTPNGVTATPGLRSAAS